MPSWKVAAYVVGGLIALIAGYGAIKRPDFIVLPRRRRFRQVAVPGMIVSEAVALLRKPPRGYTVYQVEEAHGLVVLMDGPGLFSLGSFYPIYVDPSSQGVLVTCAIEPKTPLYGPPVSRRLFSLQRIVINLLDGTPV